MTVGISLGLTERVLSLTCLLLAAFGVLRVIPGAVGPLPPREDASAPVGLLVRGADPSIGSPVSFKGVTLKSGQPFRQPAGEECTLVMLGPCSSCSIRGLQELRLRAERLLTRQVYAVTTSPKGELEPELRKAGVAVLLDPRGALHSSLKVQFAPKLAVVDRRGRLLALQQKREAPEAFLRRTKLARSADLGSK